MNPDSEMRSHVAELRTITLRSRRQVLILDIATLCILTVAAILAALNLDRMDGPMWLIAGAGVILAVATIRSLARTRRELVDLKQV